MQDVTIAAVQMRSIVGDFESNPESIDRIMGEAVAKGAKIVCFPELSVSGYNVYERTGEPARGTRVPTGVQIPSPTTDALESIAARHDAWMLVGLLEIDSSGITYNTQLVVSPEGIQGKYRKTHVPTTEIRTWRHGDELPVFEHPKVRFGVEICYDTHFPEVSTALSNQGAELIFMPHASGGDEPAQDKQTRWERYVPARAYDNTVYAAICNQVGDNEAGQVFEGVTFICDPTGKLIAESKDGSEESITIANLSADALTEARKVPETFFRHFRRPEKYSEWGVG